MPGTSLTLEEKLDTTPSAQEAQLSTYIDDRKALEEFQRKDLLSKKAKQLLKIMETYDLSLSFEEIKNDETVFKFRLMQKDHCVGEGAGESIKIAKKAALHHYLRNITEHYRKTYADALPPETDETLIEAAKIYLEKLNGFEIVAKPKEKENSPAKKIERTASFSEWIGSFFHTSSTSKQPLVTPDVTPAPSPASPGKSFSS